MPERFALGDYVEVKDRIPMFYEAFPDGRLVTDRAEYWLEVDPPRVVVKALAYRTPDDPHPGVGWSWLEIPGKTPYTRGSELENAETSAWGRAIAALGIGISRSIASKNEVDAKASAEGGMGEMAPTHGSLIGTLITQGNQDFQLRETPDGWMLPFRIKSGDQTVIVMAEDAMAQALDMVRDDALDQQVQVWGSWSDESFQKGRRTVNYRVLHLTKIKAPEFVLPADIPSGQVGAFDDPISDEEAAAIIEREKAEAAR